MARGRPHHAQLDLREEDRPELLTPHLYQVLQFQDTRFFGLEVRKLSTTTSV